MKTEFAFGPFGNRPFTLRAEYLAHDFRTIIDATDSSAEVTWQFNPHIPKGTIRVLFNYRFGGETRR